jgi:hypothetical protein
MYNQVIGNGTFSELVNSIQGALMGSTVDGVPGSSLLKYAKLYANDMIMNFHQEVNMMKAEKLEMKYFLYIGDIMETTRDFCKERAGMYFSKKEIESWKFPWAGKRGPALVYRGGWNCRHHWQAIRPEWLDIKKGESLDIGDWDLENRPKTMSAKMNQQKASLKKIEKVSDSTNIEQSSWTEAKEYQDGIEQLKERVKINDIHVDGLSEKERIELLNLTGSHLSSVVDRFPNLKKIVDKMEYNDSVGYVEFVKGKYLPDRPGSFGEYNSTRRTIEISAGLQRTSKIAPAVGSFNVDSTLPGVLRHEWGHHLHEKIPYSKKRQWREMFAQNTKIWGKKISVYGMTDEHEAFAEAFAAYTHPGYSTSKKRLPKMVEDYFMEVLQ